MLNNPEPRLLIATSSILSAIDVTSLFRHIHVTKRGVVTSLLVLGLLSFVCTTEGKYPPSKMDICENCAKLQTDLLRRIFAQRLLRMCKLCRRRNLFDYNPQKRTHTSNDAIMPQTTILSRHKRLSGEGDRRLKRLFNKNDFFLEILPNGRVRGTYSKTKYTEIEVQSVSAKGVVRFFGRASGRFLSMNRQSRLYGSRIYRQSESAFVERWTSNFYVTYRLLDKPSRRRKRRNRARYWYIGIDKRGRPRKGKCVTSSNNSAQFLPLPV
uniref:FGF n=1 Tax=Ciona savignyi TaxID=51511 RepID=H2ZB91_CIOSA